MKEVIRHFVFLFINIILLVFQVLNAQDITGDWYGAVKEWDSTHVVLHVYKDQHGFQGTIDNPDPGYFGFPIDEITLEGDSLFYRKDSYALTFKGHVNKDYTVIKGEAIQSQNKYLIVYGRKKLKRIVPVDYNSLNKVPAEVMVIKAANPQIVPYSGVGVVEAGAPKVIKKGTSEPKVLTPGKATVERPMLQKFPEPITVSKYPVLDYWYRGLPTIVRAKESEPIPAQPMRMKEGACFNIQYLTVEQGLNDPKITSILEDMRGNMWFGSATSGVFKYDGRSFIHYTITEGLTSNGIREIIEDRSGNIWIGTNWGLCKYDGNSFTHYSGLLFGAVLSILESKNGNIWFGTQWAGVIEMEGNTWKHYRTGEGLINNTVNSIIEDRNGNLWFGTERGACKFDGVSFTHFTEKEGLISSVVRSVIEDKYGNIWFGTSKGVSKYDGKSFMQFTGKEGFPSHIESIMEDGNGNLWFGTWDGVILYDGSTFTHYTANEGLSDNGIVSIIEDSNRNIWLTTYNGGVMKLQRNSFTYFMNAKDLGKSGVLSVIEDHSGNIWFTSGEGLIKFDGESFLKIRDEEEYFRGIRSMIEDKDGNIWFTNTLNPVLQKYNGKTLTIYNNSEIWNGVYGERIYEDKKGNIWVGTWGQGIKIFDGKSFTDFIQLAYVGPQLIESFLQDRNENIWYGGFTGLLKYDGECITKYNMNEGLSSMTITSLFEDEIGNLWVGTEGGGINKFDGQSFTIYTEKEGLSNNTVMSVIGDNKGNIWVGTKTGLSLISPREDRTYSITSFSAEDGLKNPSFNYNAVCIDSRNRIWWGTGEILTMLDLNKFETNTNSPVIQLNNIKINQQFVDFRTLLSSIKNEESSHSDTVRNKLRGLKFSDVVPFSNYPLNLELAHYLNHITFEFSAIDWTYPQSIKYQYMIEGLDDEWSTLSKENQADYRNIPSGSYTFKVKAISKANLWSDTFEYPFKVRKPWWFQWWAISIYIIAFILIARYLLKYIISRERIKAEVKIKQVEVDKMQELDHMKSRFFANISHEFRTPLTLLLGPINDLIRNQPGLNDSNRNLLKIMKRNTLRLQQLINQLLDLSKLETGNLKLEVSKGDLTGFVRIIVLSFLSLAESKHIKYEYDLAETEMELYFDGDKVEKIIMNFISNALKFTPDGGSVKVILKYFREEEIDSVMNITPGVYAKIIVKDSGPGIPDNEKEKIFDRFYQVSGSDSREHEGSGIGLALAKELLDLYRGKIHVESEIGKGSIFTVMLPVSRAQFREGEIVAVSQKVADINSSDRQEISADKLIIPDIQKGIVQEKEKDIPIILIVEDNADLRKYISGNLLDHYHIIEAQNGKEGLDKAIENIPDLIISDLMMPEMDGMEMCMYLKKDIRTNHIPLIMLTAKADRESKLEGLEMGADDYIIKPFDAEELQVRVKNLIEQRKNLRERYQKEFLIDPSKKEIARPEDKFLVQLMECIIKNLEDPEFSVKKLGEELNLSHTQLYRKVLSMTNYTPNEYIRNVRLKTAARIFLEGNTNITGVLYSVGYNSPSYFTQSFKELFGLNPSDYIRLKRSGTKN